jgi:hypothetical protein
MPERARCLHRRRAEVEAREKGMKTADARDGSSVMRHSYSWIRLLVRHPTAAAVRDGGGTGSEE